MKVFKELVLASVLFTLVACGQNTAVKNEATGNENKIKIVTTIYPEYDWVKNIIKGKEAKYDISILMTSGVDLHNFQPTAKDILDIGTADLFVYVGGESDDWVEGALRQATNDNLKVVNLMEVLDEKIKVEELKEGMEEDGHEHEEGEEEHEEGEEENEVHVEPEEYDEHVWLSLNNAVVACEKLESEIESIDSDNRELYKENLNNYISELRKLDSEYKSVVSSAKRNVVLFGDRFPFRYMVEDYGIDYFAAFKGCAAETEASFKTIKFLSDKLSEEKLPYVLKIEKSEEKIARAIINNSTMKDAKIETMYSIQAVSDSEIKKGETYLTYMKKNLEVLKKVLN